MKFVAILIIIGLLAFAVWQFIAVFKDIKAKRKYKKGGLEKQDDTSSNN